MSVTQIFVYTCTIYLGVKYYSDPYNEESSVLYIKYVATAR